MHRIIISLLVSFLVILWIQFFVIYTDAILGIVFTILLSLAIIVVCLALAGLYLGQKLLTEINRNEEAGA